MKHEGYANGWLNFLHGHQTLAIAVGVGLVVFAYFKPKPMFKLIGGVGIIVVIVYVISFLADLTSSGIQETTKFTDRPDVKIK